jgi:SDR family mycofactocin-dependent oxidoreductase
MSSLEGKVALITGAGRGQGRAHAVRLAAEGANIIATDLCRPIESVPSPLSDRSDLDETVGLVESAGTKALAIESDVRDLAAMHRAAALGAETFGRIDIVIANAGILPIVPSPGVDDAELWSQVLDVNLTGAWNTVQAALPTMIEGGRGGCIVLISSTAGLTGYVGGHAGGFAYTASKHGVVGLMRSLATELGPKWIRVNSIHPCGVDTPMLNNEFVRRWKAERQPSSVRRTNLLPVDFIEAIDIANAVAWLVSDAARYITGVALPVDAGFTA